jgi:hypothetical protein
LKDFKRLIALIALFSAGAFCGWNYAHSAQPTIAELQQVSTATTNLVQHCTDQTHCAVAFQSRGEFTLNTSAGTTTWIFTDETTSAPPGSVQIPSGYTRMATASMGYGQTAVDPRYRITVDATAFSQFFGRGSIGDVGAGWPKTHWRGEPGIPATEWMTSGRFLIIVVPKDQVLCMKLPAIPTTGRYTQGSIMPQSNVSGGGPSFDISFGRVGCSFDPASGNAVQLQQPFAQQQVIRFGFNETVASSGSYYDVIGGGDIYMSIRMAIPRGAPATYRLPNSWPMAFIAQLPLLQ